MRFVRRLAPTLLLLLPACLGRSGPELPENLGQTHARERAAGAERAAAPEAEPEPVEPGTAVWAELRSTGFYFLGVVVEREEARHRVIFADGAAEWVEAAALRPDSLGEDARVQVRPDYEGSFSEGVVARRLGDAVYVRFAGGDEEWASLAQVRFEDGDEGTPRRGDAPYSNAAEGLAPGARVMVDYRQGGLRFAGTITARADDGRLHVVYLDNTAEWVAPVLIEPERLAAGDVVHVRRRWEPPDWVRGRVHERIGPALSVELEDGGLAWTSLFRIRTPAPPGQSQDAATTEQPPAASQERQEPQSAVTPSTGSTRIAMGENVVSPMVTGVQP